MSEFYWTNQMSFKTRISGTDASNSQKRFQKLICFATLFAGNFLTAIHQVQNKIVGLIYLVTLFQERCLTPMTKISPDGCIIDGRHFRPGEEISRRTEGSWCFGSICNENGEVISWDNWNCDTETSTWPNIQKPSTTQQQTGCYTGERWIQLGEITFEGRTESFCYGFECNTDGTMSSWEDWNCST